MTIEMVLFVKICMESDTVPKRIKFALCKNKSRMRMLGEDTYKDINGFMKDADVSRFNDIDINITIMDKRHFNNSNENKLIGTDSPFIDVALSAYNFSDVREYIKNITNNAKTVEIDSDNMCVIIDIGRASKNKIEIDIRYIEIKVFKIGVDTVIIPSVSLKNVRRTYNKMIVFDMSYERSDIVSVVEEIYKYGVITIINEFVDGLNRLKNIVIYALIMVEYDRESILNKLIDA